MIHKFSNGLSKDNFIHPLDLRGIKVLEDQLKSKLIAQQINNLQNKIEDDFYLENLATNIRLSEKQGKPIYRQVQEVASILGVPTPNVFLATDPYANAYALGGNNPTIVLTSSLVDTFSEDALRAVIAHELGHIICKHTFYRLLAQNIEIISQLASFIPWVGQFLSVGFQAALFDWYRKSELSADRAALLGTQNIKAVQQCILSLAGGTTKIAKELKLEPFKEQAKEFQDKTNNTEENDILKNVNFFFLFLP